MSSRTAKATQRNPVSKKKKKKKNKKTKKLLGYNYHSGISGYITLSSFSFLDLSNERNNVTT
jgi:hypothetical protein